MVCMCILIVVRIKGGKRGKNTTKSELMAGRKEQMEDGSIIL